MPYKITIRPLAALEIIEAYDWYESQQKGLGEDFIGELENFYSQLSIHPSAFSYYEIPVRQGKIKRFPYVVVFEVFDHEIVVYSVFMTKRDPEKKRSH